MIHGAEYYALVFNTFYSLVNKTVNEKKICKVCRQISLNFLYVSESFEVKRH